ETVSTYSGHPIAMAAICANLEYMIEENLVEKAKNAGEYIEKRLNELKEKHPTVGLVAGAGVLWIVELVKDDKNRPFITLDRNTKDKIEQRSCPMNIDRDKAIEKGDLIGGFVTNT